MGIDPKTYTLQDVTDLLTVLYCYSEHIAMSADLDTRNDIVKRRTELTATFAGAQGAFRKAVEGLDEAVSRAKEISNDTKEKKGTQASELRKSEAQESESQDSETQEEKTVKERRGVLAKLTHNHTGDLAGTTVRLARVLKG